MGVSSFAHRCALSLTSTHTYTNTHTPLSSIDTHQSPLNAKSYEFSGDGDTVLDLAVKRGIDNEVLSTVVHKGGKFSSLSNVKKGRAEPGVSRETALFLRNEFEAYKVAAKQQKREAKSSK
jgi:hypothetical protein